MLVMPDLNFSQQCCRKSVCKPICVCEREREHMHSCACAHIFQMSRNYLKILGTRRVKQFSYRGSTYLRHHHKKMYFLWQSATQDFCTSALTTLIYHETQNYENTIYTVVARLINAEYHNIFSYIDIFVRLLALRRAAVDSTVPHRQWIVINSH